MDRKIIFAIVNTLVAAAILMPMAAQANDGLGQGDVWTLPAAAPGTEAHYTIQTFEAGADGWEPTSKQMPFLTARFGAQGSIVGPDGTAIDVVPVSMLESAWVHPYDANQGDERTTRNKTLYLDPDTRWPVGSGWDKPLDLEPISDGPRLMGQGGQRGLLDRSISFPGDSWWSGAPCVLAFGAGERRIDQDRTLQSNCEAFERATHPDRIGAASGTDWMVIGQARWDAVGVAHGAAVYETYAAGSVRVWLSPESPLPLQLQLERDGHLTAIMLASIGTTAPVDPPVAPRSSFPLDWRPVQAWGMDESGIDHGFPASEAWAHAEEHPDVRAFLDDHGNAILSAVHQNEVHAYNDGQEDKVEWSFRLADETAGIEAAVMRDIKGAASQSLPVIGPVPGTEAGGTEQITVEVYSRDGLAEAPPNDLHVPTPASLHARLLGHLGAVELPLDGWGYSLSCIRPELDHPCGWTVMAQVHVDHRRTEEGEVLEGDRAIGTAMALLTSGDRTVFAHYRELHHQYAGGWPSAEPLQALPDDDLPQPRDAAQASLAPSDWVPIAYAGILATLAGLATYVLTMTRGMWLGLFTRIRTSRLLHHPMRQMIHDAVQAEPGIHVAQLVKDLQTSRNNIDHHVRLMVNAGLLRRQRGGRYACLFLAATGRQEAHHRVAAKSPGARRVLEAVAARPGIGRRATSRATGLSPSTVSYHIGRLLEAGVLVKDRNGVCLAK